MSTQHKPALDVAEIARRVAAIWTDVLGPGSDRPGATFFELNGQSIAAVRIVAAIEDELGITVDLGDLFEDPDLATLTRDIVARSGEPVG
jgi:acyl carrier protein